MDFEDGVWLDDPRPVLRDHYTRVQTENEADIVVFFNSDYVPLHASRVNHNGINRGKNGSFTDWYDPKILHTSKGLTPIYYKRRW